MLRSPLIPSQNEGHGTMQLNLNLWRNHLCARFTHSLPVNSCNWTNSCKITDVSVDYLTNFYNKYKETLKIPDTNTEPHSHDSTHSRITIYISMTHTDMHIYQTNQNRAHIPSSAPPIGDFTPSGRSDSHPNHRGCMYTTLTIVSQTHMCLRSKQQMSTAGKCFLTRPNTRTSLIIFPPSNTSPQ